MPEMATRPRDGTPPSFDWPNVREPRIGHWLVSGPAAAAPEPATLSIFACSMLSLPFLECCGKRWRRAS